MKHGEGKKNLTVIANDIVYSTAYPSEDCICMFAVHCIDMFFYQQCKYNWSHEFLSARKETFN